MSRSAGAQSAVDAAAGCSLLRATLSAEQAIRVAPLLRALGDPARLRLMSLLASHDDGEACVCDLAAVCNLSQPTISHHLKVMHGCGLLSRDKRGVWVFYRVRVEALAALRSLLSS